MDMKKHKKIKLGDVYAIHLPDGKYGFGRILRDSSISIYKHIGVDIEDLPKREEYQFVVGIYDIVLKSGIWTVVDNRPFANKEEGWPPPTCIIDKITGGYSIYYRGDIRESSKEECAGLEETAVWDAHHIIDRIMGDDKWNRR